MTPTQSMTVKGRVPCGSSRDRLFMLRVRAPKEQGTCLPPDAHRRTGSVTGEGTHTEPGREGHRTCARK